MKTAIKNITNIRTGIFAKPAETGEVVYLQAKHFDESGSLSHKLHPDLKHEDFSEKHLLSVGDVLFAAKGSKNFAATFEQHHPPSVASTSFFVLRTIDNKLLPRYLAWLLNSQSIQLHLKGQAIGTSIPSISKQVLENLELTVPSIETQRAILKISDLRSREKALKLEIEQLREMKIQQQILEAINHES